MRIASETREGQAAMVAANTQIDLANLGLAAINPPLPPAQHLLRQAWGQARNAASAAITAFNHAIIGPHPAAPDVRMGLVAAARAAVLARDQARAQLAAGGVPNALVQAATALDAASDAKLAASVTANTAIDQIPTFVTLAGAFGFAPFTDYARREGPGEFFAETYALYLTDPNRLNGMNRRIFLWFEAGMPMNPAWRPAP
jgi:hypothetical protein